MAGKPAFLPAYPSIDCIEKRNGVRQFLLLQLLIVHIKTGKQYVVIGHAHGKAGMALPSSAFQRFFQNLPGKSGIIPAGTDEEQLLPLISRQR
mgnify:CR=1 FL=1